MTITNDRRTVAETGRWAQPPGLCAEGAEVAPHLLASIHPGDIPWLWCCLPDGHEPPHYDYERGLYWFKPEPGS